jgi:hypothetical protein
MKSIKFCVCLFLSLSLSAFFSCDNNLPLSVVGNTNEKTGVVVKDGYLVFQNMDSFKSTVALLSAMPNYEQKIWSSRFDYISLETIYDKEDALLANTEGLDMNTNRISSKIFTHLFNERGILMIGNTIVKVQDQYAYSITDGDFSTLEKIEKGENLSNLDNIKMYAHTRKLTKVQSSLLRDARTSDILWTSSDNKRREYVKYITEINVIDGATYLIAELHGRAQNKFTFFWGLAFDDEMVNAKISLVSGTWTCYEAPGKTYDFESFTGNTYYNVEYTGFPQFIGLSNNLGDVTAHDLKIKYTYLKHTGITSVTETLTWNGTL